MFKSVEEIKAAKTSELVDFWNAKAEKPIKKFADRATAEKRCCSLLAALEAIDAVHADNAAAAWEDDNVRPVVHKPRQVKVEEVVEESTEELSDEEFEAKMKSEIEAKSVEKARASNAAGIARSWSDPEVYNARLTRNGVVVEWAGKKAEFKSVRAAFAALGLPDSKHIRFRMKLKDAKVAVFPWAGVDYKFFIS